MWTVTGGLAAIGSFALRVGGAESAVVVRKGNVSLSFALIKWFR